MRKNAIGEVYVHTVDELRQHIEESEGGWECYLANVDPPDGDDPAIGEVADNGSGDIICMIEADTEEEVRAIAREAKLDGA